MQPDNISDHYLLIPSQQISCRVSCNGLLENRIPFQLPLRTDSKLYPCTKRQEHLYCTTATGYKPAWMGVSVLYICTHSWPILCWSLISSQLLQPPSQSPSSPAIHLSSEKQLLCFLSWGFQWGRLVGALALGAI
jgi:hypothetical protein